MPQECKVGIPINQHGNEMDTSAKNLLLQMEIEGNEIVDGAISAFKELPHDERRRIISSLDKVRTDLMKIT